MGSLKIDLGRNAKYVLVLSPLSNGNQDIMLDKNKLKFAKHVAKSKIFVKPVLRT